MMKEAMIPVVGSFATFASLLIIMLGLPGQIIKNYQMKTVKGFSRMLIFSATLSYTTWTAYAWLREDIFLIISQTPGAILILIIMAQMFHYDMRRKK